MADDGKTPITSGAPGAGANDQGGGQRKIAGKYNSTDDAIVAIETAQTKNYHETREELGAIRELLERSLTTPIGRQSNRDNDGNRGNYDDNDQGYRRGRDNNQQDDFDPTEFLTDPSRVLNRRDAKLRQDMEQRQHRQTAAMIANASAVLRFQMKNADLDEHEGLVQSFLGRTDERLSISRRLDEAAKETRKYLAKLKGKGDDGKGGDEGGAGRDPDNDEFVEGTAGGGQGRPQGNQGGGANDKVASADDELTAEIQERRKFKSSRFAAPQK